MACPLRATDSSDGASVYENVAGPGYLLDVQTDLLLELNTRVVVPLIPQAEAPVPARRLNPVFEVAGEPFVTVTQFMAAVPASVLGSRVTNLAEHHTAIMDALDMLFTGF